MTIEAMKLALEALEKCDSALAEELAAWDIDPPLHHVLEASNACAPAITAIREVLAQPEQEPVACVQDLDEVKRKHLVYEKGMDWKDPLYTSPPPRKPLLASDIVTMYDENPRSDSEMIAFARAIEAAHGIKGESK